ncbi:MAG: hypothetical protein IKA93_00210 [Elusimicrobiaceae bacterium]|nr:hypothetical protein [Elusimicrobiaceae bacterium]
MRKVDLHCNIDEDLFSFTVFLTRLLAGGALLYMVLGCLLFYREFLYNATAVGIPLPVPLGIGLVVSALFLSLLLLLGWFTRFSAWATIACSLVMGYIFFAGDINRFYVMLLVLLLAALLPSAILGPGKISLDYKHALRKAQAKFRG